MSKRKQFEDFKQEFEDFCACGEFYGDICESDVKFVVDYCSELINPWKDASKELPRERVDAGVEVSDVVLCWVENEFGRNYYISAFYCYCSEYWKRIETGDAVLDPENILMWMYIPEVSNED